jgi:multiple sugar transport system substrate-binding protein
MSNRRILFISVGFLVLVLIASLGFILWEKGIFTKKEEPVFISYVGLWDPEIITPLKIEFQKQNPNVTIEYEQKNQTLYFETLQNLLSKEKPPDIFWWHSGWGPMLKDDLATMSESVLSTSEYEETYYPVTKADAKIGGAYRGVPLGIDGLALIYNKNLLSDAKLAKPPKTWSELQRYYVPALNKYDKKKGIIRSTISLGTANNISNYSEIVGLLFLQNGVSFVKDGDINIHESLAANGDNLGQKTLEFYASFVTKTNDWDNTQPNSIRAFAIGKAAMIILPAYKIPTLQSQIKAAGGKVKFGVTNVPQPPEISPVTWASYWLSGVSAKSEHREESWKFIKFLSEPENLKKLFKKELEIRKIGRPYPRVDMEKELRGDKLLSPYVAQAKSAKSWYLHSDTTDKSLNDKLIEKLSVAVTKMSQKKGSSKGALNNFADQAKGLLVNYGVISPEIIER